MHFKESFKYIASRGKRQALLASCFVLLAYIGWFFTRTHIKAVQNILVDNHILTRADFGLVASIGFAVNFFSKILAGSVIDASGRPKLVFVVSLLISAAMVLANTILTQMGFFVLFLSVISLVSAAGRLGTFKIIAMRWPKEQMGFWGGIINASANMGELSSKLVFGALADALSWKEIFYVGASIGAACCIPLTLFVSDHRPTPPAHAVLPMESSSRLQQRAFTTTELDRRGSLVSKKSASERPSGQDTEIESVGGGQAPSLKLMSLHRQHSILHGAIVPLFKIPRYWMVLAMALSTTALRELLNTWLPTYFKQFSVVGDSKKVPIMLSAIFNVVAIFSSIIGGVLVDHVSKMRRGLVNVLFLGTAAVFFTGFLLLSALSDMQGPAPFAIAIGLLVISSFCLIAPNSFNEGVFLTSIVGVETLAVAAGIVGASGYAGSAVFAFVIGKLAEADNGWSWIWGISVALTLISLFSGIAYWIFDRRHLQETTSRTGHILSPPASLAMKRLHRKDSKNIDLEGNGTGGIVATTGKSMTMLMEEEYDDVSL